MEMILGILVCAPNACMYATPPNPDRCPVQLYMFDQARRPADCNNPNDPFYLASVTHDSNSRVQEMWFVRGPIGVNKLANIMKYMAKAPDLPDTCQKRLTNTSVTLIQKMTDNNIPDNLQTYLLHWTQKHTIVVWSTHICDIQHAFHHIQCETTSRPFFYRGNNESCLPQQNHSTALVPSHSDSSTPMTMCQLNHNHTVDMTPFSRDRIRTIVQ